MLDMQRRGQQTGRIRIGQLVPTVKDPDKMRPAAIDTFRLTTKSEYTAYKVAELLGGTVQPWRSEFEVITRKNVINVLVPPRDAVISQWYEMWSKGGCQRRCDSVTEQISGKPCLCPRAQDPDDPEQVRAASLERDRLSKLKTPQGCSRMTRLNVMIPDLPDLGVWRLDTKSFWAAGEMGDKADALQMAREQGIYLPAVLRIEPRERIARGETTKFVVPVLELLNTVREIASGALAGGGIVAQLPPAPSEPPKAITAAPAAPVAAPAEPARPEVPVTDDAYLEPWQRATDIANRARATKTPNEFRACAAEAEAAGLMDESACINREKDEWQDLRSVLEGIWADKTRGAA